MFDKDKPKKKSSVETEDKKASTSRERPTLPKRLSRGLDKVELDERVRRELERRKKK